MGFFRGAVSAWFRVEHAVVLLQAVMAEHGKVRRRSQAAGVRSGSGIDFDRTSSKDALSIY